MIRRTRSVTAAAPAGTRTRRPPRPATLPRARGVRRLILTHIGAEYHDDVGALAEEARERFSGDVEVARELVPYPL